LTLGVVPATTSSGQEQICSWTIGIMGALKGTWAYFGRPAARGVRLAVDQANESGELSCTLETHSENTGGDPNQAPAKARRLVNDDDLVACVCGFFSGETLASGQIFREAGVAMLSTGEHSTIRDQGFRTWFRLVAPADEQGRVTGIYIRRVLGARHVSIVHDGQSYSKEIAREVRDEVGWRMAGPMIRLSPEEADYDRAAVQVRRQSPDVVFYAGYSEEAWHFLPQLREAGVRAGYVTDGGAKFAVDAREAKAPRGKLSCACTDVTAYDDDQAERFVDEYRSSYGVSPTQFAVEAFDGTNIVIEALEELTGAETIEEARAHIVSYLDTYHAAGTTKTYSWNDKGEFHTTIRHVFIWEWRRTRGFRLIGSVGGLTR
jgi:branched-chain amino acid transport system substrate-binding protein